MFEGLKGLLASKKFWLTIIGSGVVAGMSQMGLPQDIVVFVGGLFGVNIAAQGAADFGKARL